MDKLEIVNDIIDILKSKAPLSHLEGGAMIFELEDKKIVYYIENRSLYKVIPGEDNILLAKFNMINKNPIELIKSVSELELLVILNELKAKNDIA